VCAADQTDVTRPLSLPGERLQTGERLGDVRPHRAESSRRRQAAAVSDRRKTTSSGAGRFARLVGVPLGLEPSPTIVVKRSLRLLSAFALTACATYSPSELALEDEALSPMR